MRKRLVSNSLHSSCGDGVSVTLVCMRGGVYIRTCSYKIQRTNL